MKKTLARSVAAAVLTGASLLGASAPASAATATRAGSGDVLIAIFYEHADGSGRQLWYYGTRSCTSTTSDTDYAVGTMPAGWNDIISRVRDFNSCDVKLYTDGNFRGSTTGYVNYGSGGRYVGDFFNDKTSSFKVS